MLDLFSSCERTVGGFVDAAQGTGWRVAEVVPNPQGVSGVLLVTE
jgi:hypothetical protein